MDALALRLREHRKSGVYRSIERVAGLPDAAQAIGFAVFRLDFTAAQTKASVLGAVARELGFPKWAGRNWDALEDCLTDLSWIDAPGILIEIEGYERYAKASADGFIILLDIFKTSAEYWRGEGKAFWVVLSGKAAAKLELPTFFV
jgi:RNAse (barnase) inhibitor barstar